jgi:pimeloyl-ACP methyl ester carboxylesterase
LHRLPLNGEYPQMGWRRVSGWMGLMGAGVALAAAAPAGAAVAFQPCPTTDVPRLECGQVQVPIDRSGGVPGTFSLPVQRVPATTPSGRPPIFAFAGGPGQTNSDITPFFAEDLAPALADRDLIVFDQRGTGATALDCADLSSGPALAACATQIGPRRNFFTTRDSADDADDVRTQLGVDKVALFGVSYGTWLEQGYAVRHPAHVESIVMDSTVAPSDQSDPFATSQFKAAPEIANAICGHGRCKGITSASFDNVKELFRRLTAKPLKVKYVDPKGHRKSTTLSALGVAALLPNLDVDPHLRANLPRAVESALNGDPAVLARLVAGTPTAPAPPTIGASNQTLFYATTCEEHNEGFDRGTASPEERIAQGREAIKAIPAATFAPFGPEIAFAISAVPICAYWPMLPAAPVFGSGPPANVPTLLVHGEFDLRTPRTSTEEVSAAFPQSKTLTVPNTGHSAVGNDLTGCAASAASAFFKSGTATTTCPRKLDPFRPRALAPRSLRQVKPAGGVHGSAAARRLVAAAQLTVSDELDQLDLGSFGDVAIEPKVRGGGLRGGSFKGHRLSRYVYVGGVQVSGVVTKSGTVTLKVPGGTLRFARNGRVTGTVRGRPVSGRAPLERLTIAAQLEQQAAGKRLARPVIR